MANIQDLRNSLEVFEQTPKARGFDLRLTLASLILESLDRKGWTQKRLAAEAKMKEPFISRLVHSESNCEFDTVGRILHALGIRARLVETRPAHDATQTETIAYGKEQTQTNTEQVSIRQACTNSSEQVICIA